jgi:hypothetical protein
VPTDLRDLITVFGNIKLPKIATFFNSEGCKIKNEININQKSQSEQYTALHILVQQANVGATRVLLANGALDEWKDRYGKQARDYVQTTPLESFFVSIICCPIKSL